jgi:hypothetical protein
VYDGAAHVSPASLTGALASMAALLSSVPIR